MQKGVLLFSAAVMLGLTGCMSYEEIRGKADAGDTEMQYQVGTMLSDGDGVKVDKKQAKEYLAKAMKSRHFLAACQLIDLITKSPDGDESELFKQSYDLIFSKKPQSWNEISLGFGAQTGIELANEYKGEVDIQYGTELAAASYGQGITITPIQMIQALTALTNDGTVLKPYIIDKIEDPNTGETVYQGKRNEVAKVYSTSTVNKMIELLDLTVNGEDSAATGAVYHTDAVRLIGKTGTANYIGDDGQYVTGTYNVIRSFAGIFPKEDPEYIIYVAVKDFQGNSSKMGAIIKELVESVAKYRNFDERPSEKDDSKVITVDNFINTTTISASAKLGKLGVTPIVIGDGDVVIGQYPEADTTTLQSSKVFLITNGSQITMPDVMGWSSSEFISFCNIVGIKYELIGYGYIQSTNYNAGDIIDLNSTIVANLVNTSPGSLVTGKGDEDDEE